VTTYYRYPPWNLCNCTWSGTEGIKMDRQRYVAIVHGTPHAVYRRGDVCDSAPPVLGIASRPWVRAREIISELTGSLYLMPDGAPWPRRTVGS